MQIRFSFQTKYGMFNDALNLPDDHTFTEEELNQMKEQRRDNWITHIETASSEILPEEVITEAPAETPAEVPPSE